jgi:hypothetical protein
LFPSHVEHGLLSVEHCPLQLRACSVALQLAQRYNAAGDANAVSGIPPPPRFSVTLQKDNYSASAVKLHIGMQPPKRQCGLKERIYACARVRLRVQLARVTRTTTCRTRTVTIAPLLSLSIINVKPHHKSKSVDSWVGNPNNTRQGT